MRLGTLLRAARRAQDLTQEALSESSLVSVRTIGDIEAGRQRRPRRDTVEDLLRALHVSPPEARAIREAWSDAFHAGDMPRPLDLFVGRRAELQRMQSILADNRLLILCGLAGVGKTRLALAAAQNPPPTYARVVFVALASTITDDDVASVVLARLGGRSSRDDAPRSIAAALRGSATLVVLDTAEHVRPGVVGVAEAILSVEGPSVLVTSRFPLGIAHERVMIVEPPPASDAVALLKDRAERAGAKQLEDAGTLLAICERLDRLPLAIELAAPRLRVLTPASLLHKLQGGTNFLVAGAPHHRYATLRDAVASNYAQLSDEERRVLRALSTFAGSWPIAAAEDLCGPSVVDVLDRLAAANFVTRMESPDGSARYWVLGVIRDFARESIAEDERADLDRRHVRCAARLVRRHASFVESSHLTRSEIDATLARTFDPCIEDILSAAEAAGALHMHEEGLGIIVGLCRYWRNRARSMWASRMLKTYIDELEGRGAFAQALSPAYRCLVTLNPTAPDFDAVENVRYARRALELAAGLGDLEKCRAYLALTSALERIGDAESVIAYGLIALDLAKALNRRVDVATVMARLGRAHRGCSRLQDARGWAVRAARAFEMIRDDGGQARALAVVAHVEALLGSRSSARIAARRAIGLARRHADASTAAKVFTDLVDAERALGNTFRAVRLVVVAAGAAVDLDEAGDLAAAADAVSVSAEEIDPAAAVTASVIADRVREGAKLTPYPAVVAARAQLRLRLQAALDGHAFATAEDDAVTGDLRDVVARLMMVRV